MLLEGHKEGEIFKMTLEEIKAWLEANKGTEEVKTFVAGLNPISLDKVKDFIGKDSSAKSWLDSEKDTHHNKALETWKTNNLAQLVDAEVKKKFPTKDPKEIELDNMKAEIEKMKKESLRKDLKTAALKSASEKNLPIDLIDHFIGEDEATTTANLGKLETAFNTAVTAAVDSKLKGTYKPPIGSGKETDKDSIGLKLAQEKVAANKGSDEARQSYFK